MNIEKPACDSSGALVFWACIGFGVWVGFYGSDGVDQMKTKLKVNARK